MEQGTELRSLSGHNPKGDRGELNPNYQGHNLVSSPLDHDHHGLLYELVNVRKCAGRGGWTRTTATPGVNRLLLPLSYVPLAEISPRPIRLGREELHPHRGHMKPGRCCYATAHRAGDTPQRGTRGRTRTRMLTCSQGRWLPISPLS